MNNKLTELVLIIDRSGSMYSIKDEAQNGINNFIKEQREIDGDVNLSLVQFDNKYDLLHEAVNINDVPEYILTPRGMTALLDAVGRTIVETGERLSKIEESARPGLVALLIVTDGRENSSHEYTLHTIKKMVEEQETKYNWQFTFLGAGVDAFNDGVNIGFSGAMGNYGIDKISDAYSASSANTTRMRNAVLKGEDIVNKFTDDEITAML